MKQPVSILKLIIILAVVTHFSVAARGQTDEKTSVEPNYDITLQILLGSNDPNSRTDLPANLGKIAKQLRSTYSFSGYRVADTFMGRLGNYGSFEYKSLANLLGQQSDAEAMSFLDWSIGNFRNQPNGFQAQSFRFGARVPVKTGAFKDAGNTSPVYSYESIGLNLNRVGISESSPTLLGTLALPRTNGTLFVVITVTPTEK